MTTTITPVELIDDEQKQLVAVAQQNGLQPETAQGLQASFAPLFASARSIIEKSKTIVVTDVSQKLQIKEAGLYRKELKNIRIAGDKLRKETKEESLKKGRAIDGFFAILDHLVSAEESRLTEQEKFAEIKEAERKAGLKIEREELLKPFAIDLTGYALGEMSPETFEQLLTGTKLAHDARIEAARKAEAERIAKEAAEQAERIRIQAENERLKKEAEEIAAKAKLEAEQAAKELAETKRIAEEAAAKAKEEADRIEKARIAAEQEAARVLAEERRIAAEQAAKAKAEAEEKARIIAEEAAKQQAEIKRQADEAARIERERVAKEQADAAAAAAAELARREAMAAEERKKAEAAAAEIRRIAKEAEEKAATEQKEVLAKLEVERQARAKIELEQAMAKKAEQAKQEEANELARKAAAAPDKQKLLAFAAAIRAVQIPALSTEAGIALTTTIKTSHDKFVAWINEKAGAL